MQIDLTSFFKVWDAVSMQLTQQAISDLRKSLESSLGSDFILNFSDEYVNEIGLLLLTILAEGLKLKVSNSEKQS